MERGTHPRSTMMVAPSGVMRVRWLPEGPLVRPAEQHELACRVVEPWRLPAYRRCLRLVADVVLGEVGGSS
jgi:hypothetical protein